MAVNLLYAVPIHFGQLLLWQPTAANHLYRNRQSQSLGMFYLIKYIRLWNNLKLKWKTILKSFLKKKPNKPSPISSAIIHLPLWLIPNATPYFWKSSSCELSFFSIAWRHKKSGSFCSAKLKQIVSIFLVNTLWNEKGIQRRGKIDRK